jgi:hypothetical protein
MLVWASRAFLELCGDGFFLGPPLGTAEDWARLHILYGPPETEKKVVALRKFFAICVGIEEGEPRRAAAEEPYIDRSISLGHIRLSDICAGWTNDQTSKQATA